MGLCLSVRWFSAQSEPVTVLIVSPDPQSSTVINNCSVIIRVMFTKSSFTGCFPLSFHGGRFLLPEQKDEGISASVFRFNFCCSRFTS
jgi:hypothetical protein